jgi:hypothetical protein
LRGARKSGPTVSSVNQKSLVTCTHGRIELPFFSTAGGRKS